MKGMIGIKPGYLLGLAGAGITAVGLMGWKIASNKAPRLPVEVLERYDLDRNRHISIGEGVSIVYDQFDRNKDGDIDPDEQTEARQYYFPGRYLSTENYWAAIDKIILYQELLKGSTPNKNTTTEQKEAAKAVVFEDKPK